VALYWVFTQREISYQQHGNDSQTRVGDNSTQNTKRDWNGGFLNNEENKKKLFSFSNNREQGWYGQNTDIEYPLRDHALQQTL